MKQTINLNQTNYLITAAALVIVIAGLRLSVGIVVPFLLAIFITIICAPPLIWLKSKGLSTGLGHVVNHQWDISHWISDGFPDRFVSGRIFLQGVRL